LAALLLLPVASAQAASPAADSGRADPAGRYIVVLTKSGTLKAVRDRHARTDGLKTDRSFSKVFKGFAGKMSAEQVQSLRADPDVAAVVPDELVEAASQLTPTGVMRIGGRTSAAARIDGVDQRVDADVAVVDTGIDPTHPDLNVVGGINCSSSNRAAWQDDNHHGTHVAGTIGAIDNGYGVVGVAPGVRLWAVRILDSTGYGLLSWYVCGLDWIATQRDPNDPSRPLIEAVNMSVTKWGSNDNNCGLTNNDILHQAICRVTAAGIPVIAAAANDHGNAAKRVPAAYPEVITVSALADTDGKAGGVGGNRCYSWGGYDVDDTFADFSNYGSVVDLIAPGKCIWSTLPGNTYGYSSGTSMAAPAVTGAVALYRASRPWTTPAQAKAALQYLGNLTWKTSTDPDSAHERLLDVSRIGRAGDYTVGVGTAVPFGETGGTVTLPVTLRRTATHFERVALSVSAPSQVTATLAATSLMGFTANNTTLSVVVPPSTPAGSYPITITGTEGPHVHSATTTIVVENDPPTAFTPAVTIAASGYGMHVTATRLFLKWRPATDASSRIASYELESSMDGGPWAGTRTIAATATTALAWVDWNHRYQFRLRARDAAGNWSDWQVAAPLTVGKVEDTSSAIRYSSGWSRFSNAAASGGIYHWTTRSGATASYTSTGRQVAIVARVSSFGGYAGVYVNGVYQGRISMYSASGGYKRVIWAKDFGTAATRTITIKAIPTASRPRVYLDAILVGR
jgi:subtilisin family serine protease